MTDSPTPRAIILSAGRGSRLGELTRNRPKCLLEFGGRTLLDRQIDALVQAGIRDIVVVIGFGAARVVRQVARRPFVRTIYNPFFQVADNLASLWIAREEMDRDFLVLNGDTLVAPQVVRTLLDRGTAPVNVTITRKSDYDADDMKVTLAGDRVTAIGKLLPVETTDAESIGLLAFRGEGPALFRQAVEAALAQPSGLTNWYLSVVDGLGRNGHVSAVEIACGLSAEIDYPEDLAAAEALVADWDDRPAYSA